MSSIVCCYLLKRRRGRGYVVHSFSFNDFQRSVRFNICPAKWNHKYWRAITSTGYFGKTALFGGVNAISYTIIVASLVANLMGRGEFNEFHVGVVLYMGSVSIQGNFGEI